jgi:serine/threonine protein kinase/tetratricopeptide (TPR) repeat protein
MSEDEHPEVDSHLPTAPRPVDAKGQTIAGYRVLQLIGEGGMGVVYEAQQEKPVRRRVALKLIKPGMDTAQVVARFESERQALALMSHPSIASIYDGGATGDGRPYFAMELVHGEPLTEYCDKNRLTIRERLELFIQACGGVQHAHQKGIIHRDLKPSNILITIQGEKPVPKIIDFGVAKATSQRLTDKTLYTQLGQWMGTPVYMSPEQAEMSGVDVDTRTDVYSLGVVLYELLAGALPFDPTELKKAGFESFQRILRETEPPKPSARVHTLAKTPTDPAKARRLELPALERELRGDLDWITMKALEKDRTRRYGSPSELAEDVRRHLRHEPVVAGPPSAIYRARKFVRRHRVGVAVAAALVLALALGATAATVGLVRVQRAEAQARQEAETARQVSDFLLDVFDFSDPQDESRGKTITARDVLDRGVAKIKVELQDQPLVRARLLSRMGGVYFNVGLLSESATLYQDAVETRRAVLGERDREVARDLYNLGIVHAALENNRAAEEATRRSLQARTSLLGKDDPLVADSTAALAQILMRTGRFEESGRLYRQALAIYEETLGEDHNDTANILADYGGLLSRQERHVEAERFHRRAVAIGERILDPDHPSLALKLINLGMTCTELGKLEEAEGHLLRSLGIQKEVLGEDHFHTAYSYSALGVVYHEQGRHSDAQPLFERALAIWEASLGDGHPQVAEALGSLAELYGDQGRAREAEASYRRALAIDDTPETRESFAAFLESQGRREEAAALRSRSAESTAP